MKTQPMVLMALLGTTSLVRGQASAPSFGSTDYANSWQHYTTDYQKYYSQYYSGGSGSGS